MRFHIGGANIDTWLINVKGKVVDNLRGWSEWHRGIILDEVSAMSLQILRRFKIPVCPPHQSKMLPSSPIAWGQCDCTFKCPCRLIIALARYERLAKSIQRLRKI